jgi:tetrahydromethanopterin S-methyltransferase subunit B
MKKIPLSIQNAITSSLTIIEDLVCEMDIVFKDENKIFSKIEKKISIEKMKKIRENIGEIKKILQKLKNELNLKEEKISDVAIINSRCAKIWEILNDLKGEKLKKYGSVSEDLKNYLDPEIEKILKLVNEIVDL